MNQEQEDREWSYVKRIMKRRAKNKVARNSRRINRKK